MSSKTTFNSAAQDIFDALGQSATFTPVVGDPVPSLQVDLDQEVDWQGGTAQVYESGLKIEYILSDIGYEANPGDIFTIDETDYTVKSVVENDGWFVTVAVK